MTKSHCPHPGTAWSYALQNIQDFFKLSSHDALELSPNELSLGAQALFGLFGDNLTLLGQRTAEMHLALTSYNETEFKPESFTRDYQQDIYQSIHQQLNQVNHQLQGVLTTLPGKTRTICEAVIDSTSSIDNRIKPLIQKNIVATRHRIHGDYHLGQLLYTDNDFLVIDFEGKPKVTFSANRQKRCLLYDIAGMLRSFDYVAQTAAKQHSQTTGIAEEKLAWLCGCWQQWSEVYFLQGYFSNLMQTEFFPQEQNELSLLLEIFLIEKALYEIQDELNNRPEWLSIPCLGLLNILAF